MIIRYWSVLLLKRFAAQILCPLQIKTANPHRRIRAQSYLHTHTHLNAHMQKGEVWNWKQLETDDEENIKNKIIQSQYVFSSQYVFFFTVCIFLYSMSFSLSFSIPYRIDRQFQDILKSVRTLYYCNKVYFTSNPHESWASCNIVSVVTKSRSLSVPLKEIPSQQEFNENQALGRATEVEQNKH